MRPRWQEWVIALALVAIGATGIVTIWGGDIARLLSRDEPSRVESAGPSPFPSPPSAPSASSARVAPPPGPAAGPF